MLNSTDIAICLVSIIIIIVVGICWLIFIGKRWSGNKTKFLDANWELARMMKLDGAYGHNPVKMLDFDGLFSGNLISGNITQAQSLYRLVFSDMRSYPPEVQQQSQKVESLLIKDYIYVFTLIFSIIIIVIICILIAFNFVSRIFY